MDIPASESKFVVCSCRNCGGHIEFDASVLKKGETRTIDCPHCHLETTVFVPQQRVQSVVQSRRKSTSPAVRVFLAFVTFCLASILVWWVWGQSFISKEPIYQMSTVTKFIPGVPGAPGRHELASEKVKIGEKQALTPEGWIAIGTEGALTLFFIGTFLLLIWKWILDSGNKKHQ